MSKRPAILLALPLALMLPVLLAAAPSSFDERKVGYEQLVVQMQTYRQQLREARWRHVHTETLDKRILDRWHSPNGGISSVKTNDGRGMYVHSQGHLPRRFAYQGVKVSGDYAVEIELRGHAINPYLAGAQAIGPPNADATPVLKIDVMQLVGASSMPIHYGGGFAFHAQNQPIAQPIVINADINGPALVQAENTSQLKKLRILRMEVKQGVVTHLMDGVPIRPRQAEPVKFDTAKPHHPQLAVSNGSVHIRRLVVEQLRDGLDNEAIEAEVWAKAFGSTTRDQAEAVVAELVADLDHNNYRVREQAQKLLRHLTELSRDTIEWAAETGSYEQKWRARALLDGRSTNPVNIAPNIYGLGGETLVW